MADRRPVHLHDVLSDEGADFTIAREMSRVDGCRTLLAAPLLREGEAIGTIVLRRAEAHPFSDKQITLLQTFADQAVIAIGNVRLFDEVQAKTRDLEESLQQQTATSDVLKVISRSIFDLKPVLDTVVKTAARLCDADMAMIFRREGEVYRLAASHGFPLDFEAFMKTQVVSPGRGSMAARTALEGHTVHVTDVTVDPDYQLLEAIELGKTRTALGVPLQREGETIGTIVLVRQRVEPFVERQIELVQTFADQAVIAIENARLFNETREALERQTATGEVLQVINSSQGDLAPVFETILEKAHSICGVSHGSLQLYDGKKFRAVAVHGMAEAFADQLRQGFVPGPSHPSQPLLEGARFAQVPDCAVIDDPIVRAAFELAGIRTVLFIPLRKEDSLLGQIAAARREVRPFTEKEIALLENFAAQAVIAMENARLLDEIRHRNDELG